MVACCVRKLNKGKIRQDTIHTRFYHRNREKPKKKKDSATSPPRFLTHHRNFSPTTASCYFLTLITLVWVFRGAVVEEETISFTIHLNNHLHFHHHHHLIIITQLNHIHRRHHHHLTIKVTIIPQPPPAMQLPILLLLLLLFNLRPIHFTSLTLIQTSTTPILVSCSILLTM